jgi:hypothetical protein
VRLKRVAAAAARVHAGNQIADDADVGVADLAGRHIDNAGLREEQVKRLFASRGLYGAASGFGSHAINSSSFKIMTLLYAPGKRLPS